MRAVWFYIFITGFIGGVAFRSFFDFGLAFAIFILILAVVVFLTKFVTEKHTIMVLVSLGILAFGLGILRFDIGEQEIGDPFLESHIEERLNLAGVVIDEPDERENHTRLRVELETADEEDVSTRALIITERFPKYRYGDRLLISGVLEKPTNFVNDLGREFDYISYLQKDDIYYTLPFPDIEKIGEGEGHPVKEVLFGIKQRFLESAQKLIPDPHVSLLGGLVVGAKQSLGEELQDDFRKTGIIHIVVLSGYNVTIVAEAIMRFFSFLPRFAGASLGAVSIVFFAVMTGASATIVRASIMALLVIIARHTERTYEITRALFLAGFLMVLHNPMIVVFDPSFQLSFLATLGLIYLAPHIEKYFKLVPTKWQLREFATATIATQIFVLPLLLYMMGELSLVALPVNLLILMFVPLTMLFGFLAGMIGMVSAILATPFTLVTYFLLAYELMVVDLFASLPFASVSIPYFPVWLVFSLYAGYGYLLYRMRKR